MNKIIYIIVLIVVVALAVFIIDEQGQGTFDFEKLSAECEENDGTWLADYNECEYVGKAWCEEAGGAFLECESDCRHDPEADICTLQCVPICKFIKPEENEEEPATNDPLNISYIIDGRESGQLIDGREEHQISPDWATKEITAVFGEPVYGDLDEDGDDDALIFLTHETGGSGTFYYMTVAIKEEDRFEGINAILLGDRIAPQTIEIKKGVAIANYADRAPDESMTTSPSIGISKYAVLKDGQLEEIAPLEEGEMVLWGNWVFGHEVRSFTSCQTETAEYWVMGDSPAMDELRESYETLLSDVPPAEYKPLFVVIAGKIVDAPQSGFGADYERGIEIGQLVSVSTTQTCGN